MSDVTLLEAIQRRLDFQSVSGQAITPLHRATGRGGQNIYDAAQVRHAIANCPGRGRRTDLKGGHAPMTNTTDTEQDRAVARVETVADWIMGAIAECDDSVTVNRGPHLGQIEIELPKGRAFLVTIEELDSADGDDPAGDVQETPDGIIAAMCPICHTVGGHDNDCPKSPWYDPGPKQATGPHRTAMEQTRRYLGESRDV